LSRAEDAVAALGPIGIALEAGGALAVARLSSSPTRQARPHFAFAGSRYPSALGLDAKTSASSRRRLVELGERWRVLDDGRAVTLGFSAVSNAPRATKAVTARRMR